MIATKDEERKYDLRMRKVAAVLVLLVFAPNLFAWGPRGHRIAARIAQAHVSEATRLQIEALLGSDDLAAVSTWADEIRAQRPETAGWHFVDIPLSASGFSEPRDCNRPEKKHRVTALHNCVVDRIVLFEQILKNSNASRPDRIQALKFLVHLVADVHQPMHAIGDARAGNDIHITEFGRTQCGDRPCNLHFLWDTDLIEHTRRSERKWVAHLESLISREHLQRQANGTPEAWANQSFHLAKRVWLDNGSSVDEAYYKANISAADKRLALAGLRLAALLNEALGK
jgi:hypothetical protein